MYRTALGFILILATTSTLAGNDIWQTLFKEKLREASRGNSNAQYDVGAMYQNGRGTRANRSKAIEWYRKAAAQNNEKASSRLKLLQSNEERFSKELARAEKGDVESQYNLGNMYTKGVGVNIDLSRANTWYEMAASQGHVKAEYKLGLIYYEGSGVKQNYKTAFKWFKSAAENGYPAAHYYLGKMYGLGQGVRKNYNTSLGWYSKAVDGGFNQARGEMIDISEKLKMEESSAAHGEGVARKGSGNTPATQTSHEYSFTMKDLILVSWKRDDKHVTYLPSTINNCRTGDDKIICYSDDQTRTTPGSSIKFKTKAIISDLTPDGLFDVTYRNLVIDSEQLDVTDSNKDEDIGGLDESIESTHKVKTGWGKEHKLECRLRDTATVSCLKNKTHTLVLTSQQTLAAGGR
jgi:TPR repeat protein